MNLKLPVYLDNNATTPMDPKVLEEMLPYFSEKFGNAASRTHSYGWEAEEAVDMGRENIASLIGAHPQEIVFTSGATEAVNLAIKGVWESNTEKKGHIITVVTEHRAVLDTCKRIKNLGGSVTYLLVGSNGLIDLKELEQAITPETLLIAVMYANNETGVIQPIKEISDIAKAHGILFFTDATQAVGKIPVNVQADGIDLLAFSAHKLYGPKGVGALYVRKKNPTVTLTAQIDGGGHERNMRSGTLNVPGIVAFGKACEICTEKLASESEQLSALRDHFETQLLELRHIDINAGNTPRLPHATNISFHDIDGEKMIFEAASDIAFSRSSACTSATLEPSYVLKAMGLSNELIHSTFRFSFGRFSTEQQVDHAVKVISKIVKEHRSERNYGHHKVI
ncbi:cysteine desulfurase family protein [Dyadobacter fanqingshengii]|uniref:cysteine desulfurase n=1 Tax=Dyadobacter fanqingshengii TaxID=2906443 RepID=A0A9X1TFL9_9BACT|nr:IscS subfamily cysteine desulfurase [Dyadobacter fanqingshengii]MCF0039652.1 IscS subfamily cysteine desulfurase [Dyadobacter fanqingshengii]USJ38582.1 IscS subfamily cysteine desulfurase [Dyadobacter fanqingshengii]